MSISSVYSVSDLLTLIKDLIKADNRLNRVEVSGEISNFTVQKNGHAYFSLRDANSKLSCVMFKSSLNQLKFKPEDGMAIVASGYVNIYEPAGTLQLNTLFLRQEGIGELYRLYELLKEKLMKEGLFDSTYKKELAKYPLKIALVAAKDSAAAADLKTALKRRWPIAESTFFLANMQGKLAAKEIIEQLKKCDLLDFDLIVLARGGGSFEDLFCFNDEALVRTIFALKTPLVSGIGHESDTSLADLVADLRAPTPTAAIELSTPLLSELLDTYESYHLFLTKMIKQKLSESHFSLQMLNKSLQTCGINMFRDIDSFKMLQLAFFKLSDSFFTTYRYQISDFSNSLETALNRRMDSAKNDLKRNYNLLEAYNPLGILKRGYAIIAKDKLVLTSVLQVKKDDTLDIRLSDGSLKAKVEDSD